MILSSLAELDSDSLPLDDSNFFAQLMRHDEWWPIEPSLRQTNYILLR